MDFVQCPPFPWDPLVALVPLEPLDPLVGANSKASWQPGTFSTISFPLGECSGEITSSKMGIVKWSLRPLCDEIAPKFWVDSSKVQISVFGSFGRMLRTSHHQTNGKRHYLWFFYIVIGLPSVGW